MRLLSQYHLHATPSSLGFMNAAPAHTAGSEIWEAPGRETGKLRESRGKVTAHWELQPTPALHDRENRQVGPDARAA
jgi:hypothetical protein